MKTHFDFSDGSGTIPLSESEQDNLSSLTETAIEYIDALDEDTAGLSVFLVGGAVRDAFLGEPASDLDFVVVGETGSSLEERGFSHIDASSFPVFHDSNRNEFSLPRTESKAEDEYGYKSIEPVTVDVSLREDLQRRDLTMNAMAIEVGHPTDIDFNSREVNWITTDHGDRRLIDPFNGRADIYTGTIHHVSEAFADDPLRIPRAARYAAYRKMPRTGDYPEIASETKDMMRRMAAELNLTSRERIGEEVSKAMRKCGDPARFWRLLAEVGALAVIAPALDRARIVPAGPEKYHREGSTFEHTMMVLSEMDKLCAIKNISGTDRLRRLFMALTHDLGKVRIANKKGGLHGSDPPRRFGGHATAGAAVVDHFGNKLGLETHLVNASIGGATEHMEIHDLPEKSEHDIIEYVDRYSHPEGAEKPHGARIDELVDLAEADHRGRYQDESSIEEGAESITSSDFPVGSVKPVFESELPAIVDAAKRALPAADGFKIMRDELSQYENTEDIDDDDLGPALAEHPKCRSPGEWIGEEITAQRVAEFRRLI